IVTGTVAHTQRAETPTGGFELDRVPDLDAVDWWYRCRFSADLPRAGDVMVLCLDGLASLADVWLNGSHLLSSENMFVGHEVDVTAVIAADNDLTIRFRSLRTALA